jgi:putative FmdB family regulatory protein
MAATMPLYEYECGTCGHRFERIQKFSDPPEKTCPKCGGEVHKLMAAPAVQFKGSGWYVTDYAGKGRDSKAKKESTEATGKTEGTEKSASEASSGSKESPSKEGAGSAPAKKPDNA